MEPALSSETMFRRMEMRGLATISWWRQCLKYVIAGQLFVTSQLGRQKTMTWQLHQWRYTDKTESESTGQIGNEPSKLLPAPSKGTAGTMKTFFFSFINNWTGFSLGILNSREWWAEHVTRKEVFLNSYKVSSYNLNSRHQSEDLRVDDRII